MGSTARQWVVALPSRTLRLTSRPLATTLRSSGTVMWMSKDALSSGWSLAGNHHGAMCGSFMVTTSSRSASQLRSSR